MKLIFLFSCIWVRVLGVSRSKCQKKRKPAFNAKHSFWLKYIYFLREMRGCSCGYEFSVLSKIQALAHVFVHFFAFFLALLWCLSFCFPLFPCLLRKLRRMLRIAVECPWSTTPRKWATRFSVNLNLPFLLYIHIPLREKLCPGKTLSGRNSDGKNSVPILILPGKNYWPVQLGVKNI